METGMAQAAKPARSGMTFRVILGTFCGAVAILLGVMALALGLAAASLHDAAVSLRSAIESVRASEALQGELMVYYRLRGAQTGASEGASTAAPSAIEASLNRWITEAGQTVDTPDETKVFEQMRSRVHAYLVAEQESLELPLAQRIEATGPALDAAFASVAEFAQISLRQAHAARAQAARRDRLVSMLSTALILLAALAILSALLVYRRLVRPVLSVRKAMVQYRSGDTAARAPATGPAEIRDIAQVFNELVADPGRRG